MTEELKPLPTIQQTRWKLTYKALVSTKGNVQQAADILGVSHMTVYRDVRKMKINLEKLRSQESRETHSI